MKRNLLIVLIALSSACQAIDSESARSAWLQNTLVEDNQLLLLRAPDLVADKFRKMSQDPFFYLRGTLGQFSRDFTTPGPGYFPTNYLNRGASQIVLVGDPHIENIGSFLAKNGVLTVDFNDFDSARYGPYHFDLRRLALSFYIAAETIGLSSSTQEEATFAVARGYFREIHSLATGEDPVRIHLNTSTNGVILDDLLERAQRDGSIQEELFEFTRIQNGRRVMFFGSLLEKGEVLAPSPEESVLLQTLLRAYPSTLIEPAPSEEFFAVKGISRRLGAGVSSIPLLRFYVLLEGASSASADDIILEFKEIRDPPILEALSIFPEKPFANNAERVVTLSRLSQDFVDNDVFLGFSSSGSLAVRVRHLTEFQKDVKVSRIQEKIQEGEFLESDFLDFANLSGRLLARGHALAVGLEESGLFAIFNALANDEAGFVVETASFVFQYGPQLLDDYNLFTTLLTEQGPLLGFVPFQ